MVAKVGTTGSPIGNKYRLSCAAGRNRRADMPVHEVSFDRSSYGAQTRMASVAEAEPAIGFYTVEQSEFTGWTGGLLVLNASGRPLEFQCTLPIRPSRAHEILYGATLRDYLIGDAIGSLLISRCRNTPRMICCDQPEALHLDVHTDCPMLLVCEAAETDEGPITDDMLPGYDRLELAGSSLRVATERSEEVSRLLGKFRSLPDIVEPFGRIREAIGEAQKQVARARSAAA